jgi:hypothetical protein
VRYGLEGRLMLCRNRGTRPSECVLHPRGRLPTNEIFRATPGSRPSFRFSTLLLQLL